MTIRLRPSYFHLLNLSVEVDVTCHNVVVRVVQFVKDTGWIEILGAGMVHPRVLECAGFDSEKYRDLHLELELNGLQCLNTALTISVISIMMILDF